MRDWEQYSTSALYSIQASLEAEIKRRTEHCDIPAEFKCDVCHKEIKGDRYQFDESAYACDACYRTNYRETQRYVKDWEALQMATVDKLTKELGAERRLMLYYRNTNPDRYQKHSARVGEIERELDEIGI